ncbi:MAG: NAD(P)-binding protein [Gammaproteobacteria bacterium]|nr:NAD(P)-binding protein [Gammaproteobacteria bacterium]
MADNQADMIIIGAGFAGLYMLHTARKLGLSARILEAGDGVGGTWYWNRYPGARCDVPSLEYSFQFDDDLQQEWQWSERYAPQAEILSYLNHVTDRFDLRGHIQFNTRVATASYDENSNRWTIESDEGQSHQAKFCVFATGCLSVSNKPNIQNEDLFKGPIYHTGQWSQQGVDFSDLNVAVVGTGSSAIQAIPVIAEQAASLSVFQRSAGYTVPAHNRPMDEAEQNAIKSNYARLRESASQQFSGNELFSNTRLASEMSAEEIRQECERRWEMGGLYWYGAFPDLLLDQKTNDMVADFFREKIQEIISDPELAKTLMPDTVFGCKRMSVDTDYYQTFNLPHVSLIDISESPIDAYTEKGLVIKDKEYEFDAIVLATGFDAMTGALDRIEIRGRQAQTLKEKWADGPLTYLGLQSAGFPNMFIITGPGSPSVLTNMIPSIEQHVEFVKDAIDYMHRNKFSVIEADVTAEDAWVAHVNEVAESTLLHSCNSWYLGANVPGKPRVFMPYLGFPPYVEKCEQVVKNEYEGFILK